MPGLAITRRPIVLETQSPASVLTSILGRIASIRGRAVDWGVDPAEQLEAEYLAGQSVEADFTQDYYRSGFVEGAAPAIMPGWAFSRSSSGTMLNASGVIESFASGEPRITDRGLLSEPAATNLLLRSQEFDNAYWTKVAAGVGVTPVVTANDAVAPDGTTTADKVVLSLAAGTSSGDYSALNSGGITVTTATAYVLSAWVKGVLGEKIVTRIDGSSSYRIHTFSGAWERLADPETTSSTSATVEIGLRGSFGSSNALTFHIWGGQVETGVTPSSYIPTAGSTATRAQDIATGPSLASSGTILMEFEVPPHDGVTRRLAAYPSHLPLYVLNGIVSASTPTAILTAPGAALVAGSIARAAVTWEAGRRALVRTGGTVASDASPYSAQPLVYIGSNGAQFGSPIRRFIRFNVALPNDQLQAMTQ